MKQSQDFGNQRGLVQYLIDMTHENQPGKTNRKSTEIYRTTRIIQNENQSLRVMLVLILTWEVRNFIRIKIRMENKRIN